jgi:hypothetical protein
MIPKSGHRFSEKIMRHLKKHDPEKLALGLDPRVGTGFPKRSCAGKMPQRQSIQHEALAL